jgi:hypothetical protein
VGDRLKPIKKAEEILEWKKEVDSSMEDLVVKINAIEQLVGKVDFVDELKQ